METPLHIAAKFGFIGLTDVLTKLGGNVNAKSYQQQTPLHLAVWNGHQQIAAMLLQRGSDSQRGDVFGRTPAHLAAIQGQEQMLKMLILTQRGSALKARDNFGRTPLHLASVKGIERLVELLIRHGSDLSARDNSQKTALHLAAESGQDTIVHSLIMHGGDIQEGNLLGQTPLHLAAQTGRKNVVKLLLERGSIVGAVNVFKQTPLHLAAESGENGYKDILKELIQHGSDVNAANIFGQTALHLASRKGHKRIVEVLVQHKSQVSALDNSRKTALDCAVESGHQEIVEFLYLSSRRGKSRSLGSLTRVQRDVNMNYISKQTPLQIRQGPLQIGIPKNGSNEFNGNKHRSTINASSLSPSFHTTIPSDSITSSSNDSYVCVPHDCRKYSLYMNTFNLLPPFFVACKQRRGVKRDEYNLEVLKKKLQQACHYRKPDIDGDVSSGPSFLEHFGPNVFNLSCHDFRRGHKCSGCFVADEASGKPKSVMEQDDNIRYAEHDLECSTNTHEFLVKQVNLYKELPADFVRRCVMIRVLQRLKNFSFLRPYQLWCDSFETLHPSEQCRIDGSRQPACKGKCCIEWTHTCIAIVDRFETLHPSEQCGIDGSRQPACKGNGCKEWTLTCKTENATRERLAIYINTKRVKRSQIGVTFTALKTENAGGERQATLHKLNRVSPLLVTIQFALIFVLVFCTTYVWYRVANMSPKFTGFMPSSATFFILPTSKQPGSTNSSNGKIILFQKKSMKSEIYVE